MNDDRKDTSPKTDFEVACESRLRQQLESNLFQRQGVHGYIGLQEDIKQIAFAYLETLHEQLKARRVSLSKLSPKKRVLNKEHRIRIDANLADWNKRSLDKLQSHEDALNEYIYYLRANASPDKRIFVEQTLIPESPNGRHEAAMSLVGGIIRCVLNALQGRRGEYTVPQVFDPAGRYYTLEQYQRAILQDLDGLDSQQNQTL